MRLTNPKHREEAPVATKKTAPKKIRSMMDFIEKGIAKKKLIKITDITVDSKFQARVETADDHVERIVSIIRNTGSIEPVCIFFDEATGKFILWDGFHRVEAHIRLGLKEIWAWVAPGNEDDALVYSCSANIGQSTLRAPTDEDKKKAVRNLLLGGPFMEAAFGDIGAECGLGTNAVRRVYVRMKAEGEPVSDYFWMKRNGMLVRIKREEFARRNLKTSPDDQGIRRHGFREMMSARGVIFDLIEKLNANSSEHQSGLIFRGKAAFSVCEKFSAKEYRAAVGAAALADTIRPGGVSRRVIFARPGSDGRMVSIRTLVDAARKIGIETMTPEEYIKEVEMERYFAARKQQQNQPAEVA